MAVSKRHIKKVVNGPKNRGRVETQPRCKIQYPMKNRSEDADKKSKQSNECQLFLKNK